MTVGLHDFINLSSKESYGWIESNWPKEYYKGSFAHVPEARWNNPMSAKDLPLYPNFHSAIIGLFKLRWQEQYQNIPSEVKIMIPDYRARITALRIGSSSVVLQAEGGVEDLSKTAAKFFVSSKQGPSTSDELSFEDGIAEFEVEDRPLEIYTELVSSVDGSKIDSRRFNYRGYITDDVQYDDLTIELDDIIRGGENENVEFKLLYNSTAPHKVLESVVSFANTDGGIIIIGVDDNGNIKGVERNNTKSIRSQITHYCDPPPRVEIGMQEVERIGKKIVYIRIPKGDNPPYTLLGHGIYVRHGSSDTHPRRSEFDKLSKGIDF